MGAGSTLEGRSVKPSWEIKEKRIFRVYYALLRLTTNFMHDHDAVLLRYDGIDRWNNHAWRLFDATMD